MKQNLGISIYNFILTIVVMHFNTVNFKPWTPIPKVYKIFSSEDIFVVASNSGKVNIIKTHCVYDIGILHLMF